jgi:uncharacterized protein YbcI
LLEDVGNGLRELKVKRLRQWKIKEMDGNLSTREKKVLRGPRKK